ncbi:phosphonate metabolism protein/1,5-bisphosphokinase (PRPP-forming) PhnN, partial [Mesorhizobium sp. M2A.F.Ca.ET.037.01.1.1]
MVSALIERELADSLPIRNGVFVAVVGPSGAGKDTVIGYAKQRFAGETRLEFVRRVITRPSDTASEDHDTLADAAFAEAEADGAFSLCW